MEKAARDEGEVELDTDESREGEAAHYVAASLLEHREHENFGGAREGWLNQAVPNGVIVTEEMIEAATLYAEHVIARTSQPQIEQRLQISAIHELCFGTPDCWGWESTGLTLHVWDFKYGHLFVDAWENWQCITYVAGILAMYPQIDDQAVKVEIHVIQPRNYDASGPIRTWSVRASDLRAHFNVLRDAAVKALVPGAATKATPAGCRDCAARHRCATLQRATMEAVHVAGQATPLKLSAQALGRELREIERAAAILEARKTGLLQQGLDRAKRGENVPFWEITESRPREAWTKPVDEVLTMGELFDKDLRKPAQPITPAQARKLGIDESVITAYSHRPRGELRLTPIDTSKAKKVFSQ
jgi:hypothetical protein